MINSVKFLSDGKTLLNNIVLMWFEDGKLHATFNKYLISEIDALNIVDCYFKELNEKMLKRNPQN